MNPWRERREIGNATLYLGDCLEIMPTLPKVDAVITDPPYIGLIGGTSLHQTGVAAHRQESVTVADPWNANLDWCDLAIQKSGMAVIAFCSYHFVAALHQALNGNSSPVALLTWYKRNSPLPVANVPRFTTEFIWCFKCGPNADWRGLGGTMFDIPMISAGCVSTGERLTASNGKALHPSQKPVELMERLVQIVPTSVIDPFMGVGSTGVACMKTGRKFYGIEQDPVYFNAACERIENAQRQIRMFA